MESADGDDLGALATPLHALLHPADGSKPVVWLGAGTTIGAGFPGSWSLMQAMTQALRDDGVEVSDDLHYDALADLFIEELGQGELIELLQDKLGQVEPTLTPTLLGLARLAVEGKLRCVITTNYDDAFELA